MTEWAARNQAVLVAEIAVIAPLFGGTGESAAAFAQLGAARAVLDGPSTLDALTDVFGLSDFERRVVIACLGVELSSDFAGLLVAAGGSPQPTFRLLLAAFPDAFLSAVSATSVLRQYRLVELRPADDGLAARLRLDERILMFLLGIPALDAALLGLVEPVELERELPAAYGAYVDRLAAVWDGDRRTIAQVCGADPGGALAIAASAASRRGASVMRVRAADLPTSAGDRDAFARMWEREAVLAKRALVIELDIGDSPETQRSLTALLDKLHGPIVVSARDPVPLAHRPTVRIDLAPLAGDDQAEVWRTELALSPEETERELASVMGQFRLALSGLQSAAAEVRELRATGDTTSVGVLAWRACRAQARPHLDGLAQQIESTAGWDDLVLPEPRLAVLRSIAAHVRNARTVYDHWGFGARGTRGLGVTALFAGASGTGKTMAAEILARELDLDLYRIDLSQMVSKFIGETEKNLRRIFDTAEQSGALLLFDEADALFGKRSEVKDSHDRYANLEVSYLLQRMEQYRGLAVLTTNMRRSLDTAFLRRLRFVIEFPFPDSVQRAEIWRRAFPPATPLGDVDHARLARLNISGGVIRSIALNAAFLAADAGEPVAMSHLNHAAREEYLKLEKPYDGGA